MLVHLIVTSFEIAQGDQTAEAIAAFFETAQESQVWPSN